MKYKLIIIFLVLLCVLLIYFGHKYLSDDIKASIIFFGTVLGVMVISGILVAIGIKAFFHS
jgi:uncharacterized membrane protein (DUF485 family)